MTTRRVAKRAPDVDDASKATSLWMTDGRGSARRFATPPMHQGYRHECAR